MSSRCALVTGASRGIGRAVVDLLVKSGREVIACGRGRAGLVELERAYPGKVRVLAGDLAEPGVALQLADEAWKRAGRIDELVLSAGIVRYAAVGKVSEADLRAQLEVNFIAPFLMTQRLGVEMRRSGGGAIVHVASTLGLRSAPATAAYAASKAALLSAMHSCAVELAPLVRVNAVAPGVVDTDMVRVPREEDAHEHPEAREARIAEGLSRLSALHPLGRLGTPQDVAAAVLYLLDAPWVTGTVLTVDGGLTAA